MAVMASNDDLYRVLSTAVDVNFYRGVYEDVRDSAVDPVAHYTHVGWHERRDPAAWFSTAAYLAQNPDVALSGLNPLYHYLIQGRAEGREIGRSTLADRYIFHTPSPDFGWRFEKGRPPAPAPRSQAAGPNVLLTRSQREAVAEAFDAAFYLGSNPDVADAGQDPLEHFLVAGWREGRDPSPYFSLTDYLELNPDVARLGTNPFVHYVTAGRAESRVPKRDLGFRHDILARLQPMDERLAEAAKRAAAITADPPEGLAQAFAQSRSGWRDLHITFSHDDYAANIGGVQLCLQREATRIEALGRDHLHIFPVTAWPMVRDDQPAAMGVLWNGEPAGRFAPADIAAAVTSCASAVAGERSFAIHSLLGHAVDDVLAVLEAAGLKAGFFWIHDFASLCDGYHLMRNDVADCGAPPPDSPACSICVYGPSRRAQIAAHAKLFDALDITAVAPSEAALETWRGGWSFRTVGQRVLPHAVLTPRAATSAAADGPFRFAFPGVPAGYKGWPIFRELALRFASDPRYQFIHLAQHPVRGLPIEHHPVAVTADRPLAMREALESLGVDAAMIWSLCRETFSFAAYEAAAAGAAVLTCPDSGNVARFVAEGDHGLVLDDEAALAAMFETGAILDFARAKRTPALYDLDFSGLTVDLLAEAR